MEVHVADTTTLKDDWVDTRPDGPADDERFLVSTSRIWKKMGTWTGAVGEAKECWDMRQLIDAGKVIKLANLEEGGSIVMDKAEYEKLDEAGCPCWTAQMWRWAEDGYSTLEAVDELYAASIMCTTGEGVVLADLKLPGEVIAFRVPKSLLDFEVMFLCARFGQCDLQLRRPNYYIRGIADTLSELLIDEVPESDEGTPSWATSERRKYVRFPTDEEKRIFNLARHYVLGLLLAYPIQSNWKYKGLRLAQAKKLRGYAPQHRAYLLSRPTRADVREGVHQYIGGLSRKTPTTQWIVRGHYRNQACGPKMSERRVMWIEPYWKGDENAPVRVRALQMGKA